MGSYSQLFMQAKGLLRRKPKLSDEEVAEALGIKPLLDKQGMETIAAARNDVAADQVQRTVHTQGIPGPE